MKSKQTGKKRKGNTTIKRFKFLKEHLNELDRTLDFQEQHSKRNLTHGVHGV